MVSRIEVPGELKLSQVTQALDCSRLGFRLAQRREEQRSENSDDRNDNQKFEKGVGTPATRWQQSEFGLAICLELRDLKRTRSMRSQPRPKIAGREAT